MKFDKQIAIILVLVSLLLSAIGVSYYFYSENKKVEEQSKQLVKIYIATANIKKDTLITEENVKETSIARQYVLTKPLLKKEIVGKFAKEAIYQNEAFLKEKLSTQLEVKESKTLDYKYNSYNMDLKMFRNPNYTIEPNDVIKIVSVYENPTLNKNQAKTYSVQYVIKNIRVLGFISDGIAIEKIIYKKKIKKIVKKKEVEEVINVKANEIILDIKEKDLLSLVSDWNRGGQLWMLKTKVDGDDEEKNEEDLKKINEKYNTKEENDKKTETNEIKKQPVKKVYKRSYPVVWYKPRTTNKTTSATISYLDNDSIKHTKQITEKIGFTEECKKTDKLLITTSNNVYLRKMPSIRAAITRKIYKNYVIAYIEPSKINKDWYVTCDGNYIQKKDTKLISYKEYLKLK